MYVLLSEPCYPGHLSDPDTTNCSDEEWVCEEHNLTGCTVDGRMIGTFPDEGCLQYLDNDKCAAIFSVHGKQYRQIEERYSDELDGRCAIGVIMSYLGWNGIHGSNTS